MYHYNFIYVLCFIPLFQYCCNRVSWNTDWAQWNEMTSFIAWWLISVQIECTLNGIIVIIVTHMSVNEGRKVIKIRSNQYAIWNDSQGCFFSFHISCCFSASGDFECKSIDQGPLRIPLMFMFQILCYYKKKYQFLPHLSDFYYQLRLLLLYYYYYRFNSKVDRIYSNIMYEIFWWKANQGSKYVGVNWGIQWLGLTFL